LEQVLPPRCATAQRVALAVTFRSPLG